MPSHVFPLRLRQREITMARGEYMRKARHRNRKKECRLIGMHDWDGPIQPEGTEIDFGFSYCRHCKAIKWEGED